MPKSKKRADGRYSAQIYLGKDENGKRKYKTVYGKTQKEVNQKVADVKAQLGKGFDILGAYNSFKQWAEMFLTAEKPNLTEQVYSKKRSNLEQFYSFIGDMPIQIINPMNIQPVLNAIETKNPYTGKPSSYKTMIEYKNVLSRVFDYAMVNRAISFNPCSAVTVNKSESKERRALSADERAMIAKCDCPARLPAMIMLYAGLRRGELTALTWEDVDLDKKIITVNKSYNHKTKSTKATKTSAGMRTVPIPSILLDELNKIPKPERQGIVIKNDGGYMSEGMWRSYLAMLLENLEELSAEKENACPVKVGKRTLVLSIQPFDWHCLRHTYATILYESGTDVLTAKEFLGHSDISTTMRIYTHLSEAQKKKSIDKLNDFLTPKPAAKITILRRNSHSVQGICKSAKPRNA